MEGEESESVSEDSSELNTERRAKKEARQKKKEAEKIDIDTNTQVQTDSKAKRNKLDEAVRKILLFKDMKASDIKGDIDAGVKLNQGFIKDTIS